MADLEDDGDMLGRDRHQIRRIGDLGNEGPVLAERSRKLQPGPRRPVVEHPPQDRLVVGDVAVAGPACLLVRALRHALTLAMVALSRATATGATESAVNPVASSTVVRRVSAAASPH